MCNRRGKKVFAHSLYLHCDLFQNLISNLSCRVHSARKHNISGLLEITELHKQKINAKNKYTHFSS